MLRTRPAAHAAACVLPPLTCLPTTTLPLRLPNDHLALHPTLDQSPKIVLAADWTQDTSLLYSHFPLKSMYSASTVVLGDLIKHTSYPAYLSSVVSS